MDDGGIIVEHSPSEQHSQNDNEHDEHFARNQIDLARPKTDIRMTKKGPMHPTPLEYSWCSTHPRRAAVYAYVLFTIIAATIGILIVCLTSPEPRVPKCDFQLRPTVRYSNRDSSHPQSVAVVDFDSDGYMDVVVTYFGFDSVGIYLGDGNSSFADSLIYSTGIDSTPRTVVVGDFNNDALPDIAVANFGTSNIMVLLGNGDARFSNSISIETSPSRPLYIVAADFNNDNCSDIAFVGYGTESIGVLLGFCNGTFGTAMLYSTGYDSSPSSMAVGDFDNNGRLDIVVTNYVTGNVGLFLGLVDGTFMNQTIYNTGSDSGPYSIAISNLNNDVHLDMAVVCSRSNIIRIFFGDGDGSFAESRWYSTGRNSDPKFVVIADFNNDNLADITVVNNGSNNVMLFLGYGDGTFANPARYLIDPRSGPCFIGVADFNNDNRLDIAIANQQNNNIKIFETTVDEIFTNQAVFRTINNDSSFGLSFQPTVIDSDPNSFTIGDFNNDNYLDIAVADIICDGIRIFLMYSDGRFSSPTTYSTGYHSSPSSIIAVDFNHDGQLDIAVANFLANNIGVFIGYGDGEFSPQTAYFTGENSKPNSLVAGDFNDDGWSDIAVANSGADGLGIFLHQSNDNFSPQITYFTGINSHPWSLTVADFNNDGHLDLAVVSFYADTLSILPGYGNGEFAHPMVYFTGLNSAPISITTSDFNNDGRTDIAVANKNVDTIGVFFAYSMPELSPQTNYFSNINSDPQSIVVADFNNDGQQDMAIANYHSDNVDIFLGSTTGDFSSPTTYSTGIHSNPISIVSDDFNNDGQQDIIVVNYGTNNVGVFLGSGSGRFLPQVTYFMGNNSGPVDIVSGDFNNDGRLDFAVTNSRTDNVGIFLGSSTGNFSLQQTIFTGTNSNPISLVSGDFNKDGRLDLAVANNGTNNILVLLGYGNGDYFPGRSYFTGVDSKPTSIVVGDFNNDGSLDFALAKHHTGSISIFLGYTDDEFLFQTTYFIGTDSHPMSLIATDYNVDGYLDIVFVDFHRDNIGILLGYGNGEFSFPTTFSTGTGSAPVAVSVSDLNNDGQLDIAFANYGTNNIGVFLSYKSPYFSPHITHFTGNGSEPTSIVAGDFNNDGWLDIAVANSLADNVGIFLCQGADEYSPQITYSTGTNSGPYSLVTGDFNSDDRLDIAVANQKGNSLGILLGNGNGDFSLEAPYFTGINSGPVALVTADFNNDGRLDIAISNYGSDNVGVFLGYGNGKFSSRTTYLTGGNSGPGQLAVRDLNNDGRLDMVVTNFRSNNVGIFLGNNSGRFAPQKTYSTGNGSRPYSVVIVDLNNDGQLDIAIANRDANNIGVFLGYGNGEFSLQTTFFTGVDSRPISIAAGDCDNDGRPDIFVVNAYPSTLVVFLGYNNGQFSSQIVSSINYRSPPSSMVVIDLNNDGRLDVAVANRQTNSIDLIFRHSTHLFSYKRSYVISANSRPRSIVVCDFNNDRQLDIAVINDGENKVNILLGYGSGEFAAKTTYFTTTDSNPHSIAAGDFNNDGRKDIFVTNYGTNNVTVFLGDGTGNFSTQMTYSTGNNSSPITIVTADLNNDGKLDLVIANYQSNNIGIFLGHGNGEFLPQMTFSTGVDSGPNSIVTSDFNNDGLLDIGVANYQTNNVGILLGYGKGQFSTQTTYSTSSDSGPYALAAGDLNNDGKVDLAVANHHTGNVGVFIGYGNGQFSPQTIYSTGDASYPSSIIIADLNNDGRLDIAVANYGTNNVGIFLGYGDGQFSTQITYFTGTGSNPGAIVAGDLNRDGRLDFVVVNYGTKKLDIFLGFNTIRFAPQTTYSTGNDSTPSSVIANDLNNDGQTDIAVANWDKSNVGVFFGDGKGHFSAQTTYFLGGESKPFLVIIADFNDDQQPDIAVANRQVRNIALLRGQGSGHFPYVTYSHKKSYCSMLVAVGDLNNDGQLDIVVANYDTDSVGVILGHGNGSFKSPSVLSTGYLSSPISVAVGDFDDDHQLDIAIANFDAGNVGVFFGYGNGTFKSLSFFSTGDSSCPISLAVDDLNNDGKLDIVVANPCRRNIIIFLDYKDRKFSSQRIYQSPTGSVPVWIMVSDFNNDNRLDIVMVDGRMSTICILLGSDDDSLQSWKIFSMKITNSPVSLAVGDFSNDGNIDIAVVNDAGMDAHVTILLGQGNGDFSNGERYVVGLFSELCAITVGDFNSDSQLDIVVINNGTKMVQIFFGNGDGTFSRQRNYPTGDGLNPISAAMGDFNNDNLTDLVVAKYGTYAIELFLAHIQTSFTEIPTIFTGSAAFPESIALGDFTNDGLLDIVVGNDGTHDISILINDGNGKFSILNAYLGDSTFYPMSIVVSDFNKDQRLDVAVVNSEMNTLTVLYREGSDTWGESKEFFTGTNSNPQAIAVGDFNNDNMTDIVVAHSSTRSVGLFLRMDNGALQSLESLSTGYDTKPSGLTVADFDNDGHQDIAVANKNNGSIGFFFGMGDGTFSKQIIISVGQSMYPEWVGFGDFNNDTWLDVIVSSSAFEMSPVIILLNNGDRSFSAWKTANIPGSDAGAVGDFNSDGDLDVVFCMRRVDAIVILLGNGDGAFRDYIAYPTGGGSVPVTVAVADFNNDNRLDIAVGNNGHFSIDVFLGHGNGTFFEQKIVTLMGPDNPISITAGDFNNDNRLDIAVTFMYVNGPGILFGYGDGTFQPLINFPRADHSLRQSINAGDFNNDGQLDIIFSNVNSDKFSIFLGHVNGTFFNEISYSTGNSSYPYSIGLGDFNDDGRLDVAVSNMLGDNIGIFLGYTSEDFTSTAARQIEDSVQPVSIAVGDFNNDTCLDIVIADRETSQIVIIRGSGYGTFLDHQTAYSAGHHSNLSWIAVDHFNQDQHLDIVVVNSGTSDIGVFLGFGDGTFSSIITSSTGDSSSPVSLCMGHFDDDTNLDVAVANFGNNNVCILFGYGNGSFGRPVCRTSGYDSRPIAVASGDIDGDNRTDVVIANWGSSTIQILTKFC